MGHHITALIGTRQALDALNERFGPPEPTALAGHLFILPLDERRLDLLSGSWNRAGEGFTYLGSATERGILAGIGTAEVLYLETNYFGGAGSQSAALFANGQVIWRESETFLAAVSSRKSWFRRATTPTQKPQNYPINKGLAALGVSRSSGSDEFNSVDLGRFRSLEGLGLNRWDDDD